MEFNKRITKLYPELFAEGSSEEPSGFVKKWSGYAEIDALAGGDLRLFDEISKLSLHKCMMHLAYLKEKHEFENNNIKKNFKK